ncbi:MAG: HU family DNA-binding protein [Acidobacteriia bacterium]|nr:HU family DNA-binding protein [Terriglobia bacterium]
MTKKRLVASVVLKTSVSTTKAREALETVLESIKRALADGRQVDLGRLGRLSVVARPPKSRACKNLKHVGPTITRMHRKHPKTVRLKKRQDLSENPQATIVHKPEQVPSYPRSVAVALPRWRGRPTTSRRR